VKNHNDQKCFVWSILSRLYPASHNPDRLQNYAEYEKTLNLDGLTFPLPVKDIPKFVAQNPTIAIHCIAADKDRSFSILYLSPHAHERRHTITLLLLDHPTISGEKTLHIRKTSEQAYRRSQQAHRSQPRLSELSASLFV